MIEHLKFCKKCEAELQKKGDSYVTLYRTICSYFVIDPDLYVNGEANGTGGKQLKYLETKNFILTTEVGKTIIKLIPTGYARYQNTHVFCKNLALHSSKLPSHHNDERDR